MSRSEDEILAAIDKLISTELSAIEEKVPPEAARNFRKLVGDLRRELMCLRQTQITIVVDRAH